MGWWEESESTISDEGLDLAEEFLTELSRTYFESIKRKPTLNELVATLNAVLRVQADDHLNGVEGHGIEIVSRVRKQGAKYQVRPGDVFSVPLADGSVAYGRMTPQASFAEFSSIRTASRISLSKLREFEMTRFPFLVPLDALEKRKWRVIGRWPYRNFDLQLFRVGSQIADARTEINGFIDVSAVLRPGTAEEIAHVPPLAIATQEKVELTLSRLPLLQD